MMSVPRRPPFRTPVVSGRPELPWMDGVKLARTTGYSICKQLLQMLLVMMTDWLTVRMRPAWWWGNIVSTVVMLLLLLLASLQLGVCVNNQVAPHWIYSYPARSRYHCGIAVCPRSKRKRLELSTPNLVHMTSACIGSEVKRSKIEVMRLSNALLAWVNATSRLRPPPVRHLRWILAGL